MESRFKEFKVNEMAKVPGIPTTMQVVYSGVLKDGSHEDSEVTLGYVWPNGKIQVSSFARLMTDKEKNRMMENLKRNRRTR